VGSQSAEVTEAQPIIAEEVERYLLTGESNPLYSARRRQRKLSRPGARVSPLVIFTLRSRSPRRVRHRRASDSPELACLACAASTPAMAGAEPIAGWSGLALWLSGRTVTPTCSRSSSATASSRCPTARCTASATSARLRYSPIGGGPLHCKGPNTPTEVNPRVARVPITQQFRSKYALDISP